MDTTVCIHPLANAPFSSFAHHKLATTKIFGFDPKPMREDEQFLKVWNGVLSKNENWDHAVYHRSALNGGQLQQRTMIKHQVTVLIHIARGTNRSLIFPRQIREGDSHAHPVYALVDMHSVDSLVRWRYMTVEEPHRQEHDHYLITHAIGSYAQLRGPYQADKIKEVRLLTRAAKHGHAKK